MTFPSYLQNIFALHFLLYLKDRMIMRGPFWDGETNSYSTISIVNYLAQVFKKRRREQEFCLFRVALRGRFVTSKKLFSKGVYVLSSLHLGGRLFLVLLMSSAFVVFLVLYVVLLVFHISAAFAVFLEAIFQLHFFLCV